MRKSTALLLKPKNSRGTSKLRSTSMKNQSKLTRRIDWSESKNSKWSSKSFKRLSLLSSSDLNNVRHTTILLPRISSTTSISLARPSRSFRTIMTSLRLKIRHSRISLTSFLMPQRMKPSTLRPCLLRKLHSTHTDSESFLRRMKKTWPSLRFNMDKCNKSTSANCKQLSLNSQKLSRRAAWCKIEESPNVKPFLATSRKLNSDHPSLTKISNT